MNQELIDKYNVSVPRYTSYPPANFFSDNFVRQDLRNAIADSNVLQPQHISFYLHIPFCYHMCNYCGCNSMQLESKEAVGKYMKALKKEVSLILPLITRKRKVAQIHYGGGSPTTQPVSELKAINDMLLEHFDTTDKPEIAIECHPAYLDARYWAELADAGFNRISIGIQDFNEQVLKTANRRPSKMPVEEIVDILRSKNVKINMDFIYGLPGQTAETFAQTISKAAAMKPDRIVTFSYAHVPWVNPAQLVLEEAGLPTAMEKNRMYETAKDILIRAGYKAVGLDHFVLPDDELCKALENHKLHRNFQGYCTRDTTGQVYAFGVTAISQLTTAYSQNVKDLDKYEEIVSMNRLPVLKGCFLTDEQQIAREVIISLMCNYSIRWDDIAQHLDIPVEDVKAAMNYDEAALAEFAEDDLIEFSDKHIAMLPDARPYVRVVAASLDKLLVNTDKSFSKVG